MEATVLKWSRGFDSFWRHASLAQWKSIRLKSVGHKFDSYERHLFVGMEYSSTTLKDLSYLLSKSKGVRKVGTHALSESNGSR